MKSIMFYSMTFIGVLMFVVAYTGYDLGSLAKGSLEYQIQNCMRISALLCGSSFLLTGLHFLNLDRIIELHEKVEKLEGENGKD